VSQYQKKHSSTHHPDHHPIIIRFFHLPWSIISSLFKLRACQSFCTSLHVLFALPLGLEPSTSYSIHFFTQSVSYFHSTCPYHRNLLCCSIKIISSIRSLSLSSLLGTFIFYLNITHPSDHSHFCSLKCHLVFFPDRPGLCKSSFLVNLVAVSLHCSHYIGSRHLCLRQLNDPSISHRYLRYVIYRNRTLIMTSVVERSRVFSKTVWSYEEILKGIEEYRDFSVGERVMCGVLPWVNLYGADVRWLWPPYGIGHAIIFLPCGFFFFFCLFFFT